MEKEQVERWGKGHSYGVLRIMESILTENFLKF
jgi:hypothetical protein